MLCQCCFLCYFISGEFDQGVWNARQMIIDKMLLGGGKSRRISKSIPKWVIPSPVEINIGIKIMSCLLKVEYRSKASKLLMTSSWKWRKYCFVRPGHWGILFHMCNDDCTWNWLTHLGKALLCSSREYSGQVFPKACLMIGYLSLNRYWSMKCWGVTGILLQIAIYWIPGTRLMKNHHSQSKNNDL